MNARILRLEIIAEYIKTRERKEREKHECAQILKHRQIERHVEMDTKIQNKSRDFTKRGRDEEDRQTDKYN